MTNLQITSVDFLTYKLAFYSIFSLPLEHSSCYSMLMTSTEKLAFICRETEHTSSSGSHLLFILKFDEFLISNGIKIYKWVINSASTIYSSHYRNCNKSQRIYNFLNLATALQKAVAYLSFFVKEFTIAYKTPLADLLRLVFMD